MKTQYLCIRHLFLNISISRRRFSIGGRVTVRHACVTRCLTTVQCALLQSGSAARVTGWLTGILTVRDAVGDKDVEFSKLNCIADATKVWFPLLWPASMLSPFTKTSTMKWFRDARTKATFLLSHFASSTGLKYWDSFNNSVRQFLVTLLFTYLLRNDESFCRTIHGTLINWTVQTVMREDRKTYRKIATSPLFYRHQGLFSSRCDCSSSCGLTESKQDLSEGKESSYHEDKENVHGCTMRKPISSASTCSILRWTGNDKHITAADSPAVWIASRFIHRHWSSAALIDRLLICRPVTRMDHIQPCVRARPVWRADLMPRGPTCVQWKSRNECMRNYWKGASMVSDLSWLVQNCVDHRLKNLLQTSVFSLIALHNRLSTVEWKIAHSKARDGIFLLDLTSWHLQRTNFGPDGRKPLRFHILLRCRWWYNAFVSLYYIAAVWFAARCSINYTCFPLMTWHGWHDTCTTCKTRFAVAK
jgi:hypothetical protein